ncbi:MAG: hypothetical protein ACRDWV_10505 [Acidimicrobiales bacterium]
MTLLAISTFATVAGVWCLTAALGLRRPLTIATTYLVLLLAQMAGLVLFVGGALRQLNPIGLSAGALVLAAAEVACVAWLGRDSLRASNAVALRAAKRCALGLWRHPVVALLAAAVVAEYAWQAAIAVRLPDISFDSLAYHLIGPATWIQHGAIVHSPQNLYSDVYPQDQEAISAWAGTFLHTLTYAGLTVIPFALMGALAVANLARHLKVRSAYAAAAGLGFMALPVVFLQAATAYDDVAAGATVLACLGLLLAAVEASRRRGVRVVGLVAHLFPAGAAAGLAVGVKSVNLVLIPFVVIITIVVYWRATDRARVDPTRLRPRLWATLGWVLGPMSGLSAFWYVRTWVTYGNPFFPVSMLGFSGYGTMANQIIGANKPAVLHHVPFGILGEMIYSWATDLTPHTYTYGSALGGLGPQWLLLCVPALVAGCVMALRAKRLGFVGGVVLPVVVISLATGAGWWTRYTIGLAGVGLVCLAYCGERLAVAVLPVARRLSSVPRLGFVGLTLATMWWATAPSDYTIVANGAEVVNPGLAQVVKLMSEPVSERYAEADPWFAYADMSLVPDSATVAEPIESYNPMTLPFVGADLQHRMVLLGRWGPSGAAGEPNDAAQLRVAMREAGAGYVVLTDAGATAPLVSSVLADSTQFRRLTTGGAVGGSDLYELGSFRNCGAPVISLLSAVKHVDSTVVSAAVTDACGALDGAPLQLWSGRQSVPVWRGSDSVLAKLRTSSVGKVSVTIARPSPQRRYFLRYAGGWVGLDNYSASASAPLSVISLRADHPGPATGRTH